MYKKVLDLGLDLKLVNSNKEFFSVFKAFLKQFTDEALLYLFMIVFEQVSEMSLGRSSDKTNGRWKPVPCC